MIKLGEADYGVSSNEKVEENTGASGMHNFEKREQTAPSVRHGRQKVVRRLRVEFDGCIPPIVEDIVDSRECS